MIDKPVQTETKQFAKPRLLMQPDGITCGAATLAMAADTLLRQRGKNLSIDITTVGNMIGTNTRTGTTDVNMLIGMRSFGLENKRSTGDENSVEKILNHLKVGDLVALRTLTHGIPHWILAHSIAQSKVNKEPKILINDPAGGEITRTLDQVAALIKPRNWEHWPISRDQTARDIAVQPFSKLADRFKAEALDMLAKSDGINTLDCNPDWTISYAVMVDDKIVGFNFFADNSLNLYLEGANKRVAGDHVENLALYVLPEYRDCGYGRLLATRTEGLNANLVFTRFDRSTTTQEEAERSGGLIHEDTNHWYVGKKINNGGYRMPDPETMAMYRR